MTPDQQTRLTALAAELGQSVEDVARRVVDTGLALLESERTGADVLADVAQRTGYGLDVLRGPCRDADVVLARHMVMVSLRRAGLSYPRIGDLMHRDHTTVLWACRKLEQPEEHAVRKQRRKASAAGRTSDAAE